MEGNLSSKFSQHWNCVIISDQMITFQTESNLRAMYALNWIMCRLSRLAIEFPYSWDIPETNLRYTFDTLVRIGAGCVTCVHLRATCASLEIHVRDTLAGICAQSKNWIIPFFIFSRFSLIADSLGYCWTVMRSMIMIDLYVVGNLPHLLRRAVGVLVHF